MTILGIDVSHWNTSFIAQRDKLNLPQSGIDFLMWKATEDAHTVDPSWHPDNAQHYGNPLFIAYHFMGDSDASEQINLIKANVPNTIPVVLDLETHGNVAQAITIMNGLHVAGYTTPLFYYPRWTWVNQHNPDVKPCPPLWASHYVAVSQGEKLSPAELYRRSQLSQWEGYGGQSVACLQFTASAYLDTVGPVDVSAFMGDVSMFAALLKTVRPIPNPPPVSLVYVVMAGDTLWEIAAHLLGDSSKWHVIADANHLANPNRLMPGQKLVIPGWNGHPATTLARTYTVKSGDTLTSIALAYRIPVAALYQYNRATVGSNPNIIHPGLVLRIP